MAQVNCFCETLHIFCKHSMRICQCTLCRVKAAPRYAPSPYYRTTSAQLTAIANLAQAKQRSLPANISTWSKEFASRYIKFLIALPFPKNYLLKTEQAEKDHITAKDHFDATHTWKPHTYLTQDGMTRSINKAIEAGDSLDLANGIGTTREEL